MARKPFEWPDYPCPSCNLEKQWMVRSCVNAGGQHTCLFVCGHCDHRTTHFVSVKSVREAGIEPESIEPREKRGICAVCKREGAENHHWAPYALFGEESNKWPQSYLCQSCHSRWHRIVTPNASQKEKV